MGVSVTVIVSAAAGLEHRAWKRLSDHSNGLNNSKADIFVSALPSQPIFIWFVN